MSTLVHIAGNAAPIQYKLHDLRPFFGEGGGFSQGVEPFLEPDDTQPAAHLVAAVFKGGVVRIAQALVEADGPLVFRGDEGVGHPVALLLEDLLQPGVELPSDAFAVDGGVQVDADLGAPAVGRALPGRTGVGIAQNDALLLPDQPGELGHMVIKPLGKGPQARNVVFKGIGGVFHIWTVDGQHGA